ncbi:MAG: hypothetical protein EZS28_036949 [Streblomastix strix]|uniref:Uncharacterized protein n=1 Tax=Streblomastix strix TaxID=222440 RepID=A0A5J4UBC6_9EUKA|nr:MAG: hypothetical protein EZS28_036949 [Streblomastix strix]
MLRIQKKINFKVLFSFIIEQPVHIFQCTSAMMDEFGDDVEEEDEYDSDADLYAFDDLSISDYELEIEFSGLGAVGSNFDYYYYC